MAPGFYAPALCVCQGAMQRPYTLNPCAGTLFRMSQNVSPGRMNGGPGGPPSGAPLDVGDFEKRLILIGTLMSLFVAATNQTTVTTALPRIIGDLGGLNLFSWVFTAFMLTSTVTMPLAGKLSD